MTSFGVILTDVDNADATAVEIYEGNTLAAKAKAAAADKKFLFVGFHTEKRKITRIKITSGNKSITPEITDGTTNDIVVMDDFIF